MKNGLLNGKNYGTDVFALNTKKMGCDKLPLVVAGDSALAALPRAKAISCYEELPPSDGRVIALEKKEQRWKAQRRAAEKKKSSPNAGALVALGLFAIAFVYL